MRLSFGDISSGEDTSHCGTSFISFFLFSIVKVVWLLFSDHTICEFIDTVCIDVVFRFYLTIFFFVCIDKAGQQ